MNKPTSGRVVRLARWAGDSGARSEVDRLIALALFPGRAPRSDAHREGCRAALEYRILGRKMPIGYAAGTCEADAWSAGAAEGHSIAKTGAAGGDTFTPDEQRLLKAWRTMDDRSRRFIGDLAAAQAEDRPRRSVVNLCLLGSSESPAEQPFRHPK